MFNILALLSWKVWLILIIVTIFVFWIIWGGKQEYEFIGVQPLTTPRLFEDIRAGDACEDYSSPSIINFTDSTATTEEMAPLAVNTLSQSFGSKGEDLVAEALQNILQAPVKRNIRPNFLRNPETGKNMEIDCFNEEYAVAVEYNGVQHYKFPSVFYRNKEDFYAQVYRDRLKRKLCDENDIYLISVPYWVDMFGTEDGHFANDKDTTSNSKIAFVPREIRYKRIYDFLYKKLSEYFAIIFPQDKNEDGDESIANRWDLYDTYA